MLPALQTFLPMAEKIYSKKTTLDILQYICLSDEKLIYTDLETVITMPVADKRSFTLPIPILKKVISSKPQSLKIYSLDNSRFSISYENKQVTFTTTNVEEYPNLPAESFQEMGMWDCDIFKKLHKQIPFASTDILRPALCGIYVKQEKGKLASVATDGHVLQYNTAMKVKGNKKREVVLPVMPVKIVSQFNRGEVEVSLSENFIRFTYNNGVEVTSRLIRESYPDFKRVIPELNTNEIILQKKEILKCIKSALPFSNTNNHQGTFQSNNGHIRVMVDDTEENTNFESSFEVVNKKGNELHQALNLQLLEKTVRGLEEEQLHWHYSDPDSASVFTNGNGVQNLIMPVRLKGDEK
jgi:DNA polymerase III beta subunit